MSETEIREGATLKLKTGATVVVRKVQDGQVWIRRPDGKFPRAVSLEWLLKKICPTRSPGPSGRGFTMPALQPCTSPCSPHPPAA